MADKTIVDGLRRHASGVPARLISRLLRTLRFDVTGADHRDSCRGGYVLAVPHMSLLLVAARHRDTGFITMASQSSDGALAESVLERLGYRVVRASTTSGASTGLREMARLAGVTDTPMLGLTVDGPRGPAWRVQPGVVALARWTGLPILPALASGPGFALPTWDRLPVPIPFMRCRIAYGPPIEAVEDVSVDATCVMVQDELMALRQAEGMR